MEESGANSLSRVPPDILRERDSALRQKEPRLSTDASVDVAVRRIVFEAVGLVVVEDIGKDGLGVKERDFRSSIRGLDRLDKVAQGLILAATRRSSGQAAGMRSVSEVTKGLTRSGLTRTLHGRRAVIRR